MGEGLIKTMMMTTTTMMNTYTYHHVVTEAGLVPVSKVVDVAEFLQEIIVVPAMEAPHVSSLATLANKNVFKPAGSQGSPGSVVEL